MSIDFSDPLTISELTSDHGWWEIYRASFPIEEREPEAVILKSLEAGPGIALRARDEGKTVGIATLHRLSDVPIAFCVYIAITASFRGHGIGRRFFEHVSEVAREKQGLGMIWEVEDPAIVKSEEEAHLRERRIQFFESLGGRLLPAGYLQPPLNGHPPVPMRLVWKPFSEEAPPDISRVIRAIYFEKYGAINGIETGVLTRLLESGSER